VDGGRQRLTAIAVGVAVALPVALIVVAVLLPGDPDDPDVNAFVVAVVVAVPAWLAAAVLLAIFPSVARSRMSLASAFASAFIVAAVVLVAAGSWANSATPPPETPADLLAGPHPYHHAADNMFLLAAALVLAGVGVAAPATRRAE
jgi:O-antigen/teichoic acid export membrane protein